MEFHFKKDPRSVLYKHVKSDNHKEEEIEVNFNMKILKNFRNPLSRQIDEGLRIKNKKLETLMNSKAEFHGSSIRRKIFEQ